MDTSSSVRLKGRLTKIASGNLGSPRLSADGTTVVYTKWNGANWDIERYRDGVTLPIAGTPRQDVEPRISADGDTIVWSTLKPEDPNGSWDVYRWREGTTTRLADSPADETTPFISPDGNTVVYTHDDKRSRIGFDIYRCEGDSCKPITDNWPVDTDPFMSGDAQRVFFRRKVRFDGGDLMMLEEGKLKQLTEDPHPEIRPALSQDGNTLAFAQKTNPDDDTDLYVRNLNTGEQVQIGESGIDEGNPSLSADGSVLAYDRVSKGKADILLRENGQTVSVTDGGFNVWPSISGDGKTLAWAAVDPEDQSQMVIYKLDRDD